MCGLDAVKGIDGLGDLVPACAPEDLSNIRLINTTYRVKSIDGLGDLVPACAPEDLSNLRLIHTTYTGFKVLMGWEI